MNSHPIFTSLEDIEKQIIRHGLSSIFPSTFMAIDFSTKQGHELWKTISHQGLEIFQDCFFWGCKFPESLIFVTMDFIYFIF